MLKNLIAVCAALIVAAAAFSTSAQAQRHRGSGGVRSDSPHFSGARSGGMRSGGMRSGGRHFGGGYRGRSFGGGYGGGYDGGWGSFAAGALLGELLVVPGPYYYEELPDYYELPADGAVIYCMQRFRSYDPRSGTYLGLDGYRHPCP